MSVVITAIILFLISFWALGYIYQKNYASISVSERRIKEKINSFNRKIKALEKEKKIYQEKISALEKDIKKIQQELENFEAKEEI